MDFVNPYRNDIFGRPTFLIAPGVSFAILLLMNQIALIVSSRPQISKKMPKTMNNMVRIRPLK